MKITERLKNERIYFDGAIGTVLQQSGCLEPGAPPEMLNITNGAAVAAMHRAYLEAGCDVISTNTFGTHRIKLENYRTVIEKGIECAKKALQGFENRYVAFSIGPTGRMLKPLGDLDFEDAVASFSESIKIAAECGADLIILETLTDSFETKAALLAAKESCKLPVFVTNAYDESGKLMTGAEPRAMIAMLEGLGADAIGMNCSFGPDKAEPIVDEYLKYSSVPVIVNPNAGLPTVRNGETVYTTGSAEFSDIMRRLAKKGAAVLGGCCGTTPEYIAATIEKTKDLPYSYPSFKEYTLVSSYTHAVEIGKTPVLIGERINPTGKKAFKQALRDGNISYILNEALRQEECGVHILDVNVGLPEIDEKEMMASAVSAIQGVSDLPLQLDSSSPDVLEKALRIYNGKPLLNSVDATAEKMKRIFPLAKKYGAAVIALAIDENGIPETASGRLSVIEKIIAEAERYGISKKNIIADPLALTVSSDDKSGAVTLEAVRLIREKAGVKTSLGVSNISFGLPERDKVNSTFFALALENGLDCAIMNPFSRRMTDVYHAFNALHGNDKSCADYIAYASDNTDAPAAAAAATGDLKYSVVKGLKETAAAQTEELLGENAPLDIINNMIIPALDEVGRGFEQKRLFLPQLLASAETATAAFNIIKQKMPKSSGSGEAVILATVKGDIHDIGKNIVRVLLESFGFRVIDLGRDVAPEAVVRAAKETGCRLVGLSALMTTTVASMQKTIELLRTELGGVTTIVGGAVLTAEYAKMIGADFYAADAMETVNIAKEFYAR